MAFNLGPFELDKPLARGGQGEVWRARHRRSGIAVAVKVLFTEAAREPRALAVFRNEIRAMAGLDHPGVTMIFDFGAVDEAAAEASDGRLVAGSPWFAMEFSSAGSLEGHRPRDWAGLRGVLVDLLDALAHAHARGVVHRDLKPANVLFCSAEDPRPGLKLADFGVAARGDGELEDGVYGTLAYMAPEQITGDFRAQGPWTDLYSLGCMAYELASGKLPFLAQEPVEWVRAHTLTPSPALESAFEVPSGFDDWVDCLLSKDPHRRFRRAADAAAALDDLERAWDLDAPPFRESWRISRRFVRSMQLSDAGLGLFDLRIPPLVGRAAERDLLWSALGQVWASRQPRLVWITGPAGYGKTRLLDWLGERAHELGAAEIVRVSAASTADPLLAIARQIVGAEGVEADEVEPRALAWAGAHDLDSRDAMALVSWLSGTATPEARERQLILGRLFSRLGAARPVVLAADDVVDSPEVLDLAAYAAHRRLPVLLVLTARDELLAERPTEARRIEALVVGALGLRLALGPLSTDDGVRLLSQRLMIEPVLAAQVAERAAGNPAFAVHIVGDWVARGRLALADGGFALVAGDDVPADLDAVWDLRLGRLLEGLDPSAREVLERAAALGHVVDHVEWQEATDDPEGAQDYATRFSPRRERVRVALEDRLIAERLVRETDEGFAFAQPMLREALIRSAREAGRLAAHHRACAGMLRRRLHHGQAGVSERLGRQLLEAGDPGAALGPLLDGADERQRTAGVREALALSGLCEQAMVDLGLQDWDERWGRLWCRRAALHRAEGELDSSRRWADLALARARAHGWDGIRAEALYERLLVAAWRGEPTDEDVAELSALASLSTVPPGALGRAWLALGRAALSSGDFDRAVAAFASGREVLGDRDEPEATACLVGLGQVALATARPAEARRFLAKALDHHRHAARRLGVAEVTALLAEADRQDGDLEASIRGHRAALALHDDDETLAASWVRLGLAEALLATGDAEGAVAAAEPALAVFEAAGAGPGLSRARALVASRRSDGTAPR